MDKLIGRYGQIKTIRTIDEAKAVIDSGWARQADNDKWAIVTELDSRYADADESDLLDKAIIEMLQAEIDRIKK
jgi:hypothetical protein